MMNILDWNLRFKMQTAIIEEEVDLTKSRQVRRQEKRNKAKLESQAKRKTTPVNSYYQSPTGWDGKKEIIPAIWRTNR